LDQSLLNSLISEALKLKSFDSDQFIDWDFKKQADFLNDKAKLKACLCTRRAGKSYGAATGMFKAAYDYPGSSILYVALTRDSAKKIMWKDCIKVIDKKHKLSCKFNETTLTATLPNGSVLYLAGADSDAQEMEKLLGQKYSLVVIDEAASWKQDLRKLVYGVLKPAVADYEGSIMMIGTPGNLTKSLYFDITNGKEPGWSVHKWNTFDNPHMARKWQAEITSLVTQNPDIKDTPLFKQMYLGEWFVDTDKLCYRFNAERDIVDALPESEYHYVLGVDLGYDPDPSAFVLCAYSQHDPNLYIVDTFQKTKMIISDVAERIKYYQKTYSPFMRIVVDSSAKQSVEEMKQRYGLPLIAAEKQDKAGFIDIMSSDMIMGRIKVLRSCSEGLVSDWSTLVWDDKASKRQENPACPNHRTDAALYAWRWSYNYRSVPATPPKPRPHTEAAIDAFWEEEAMKANKKALPFWMRDS
jgi:PBSX family phage terminase large subunit